jgi:hypothetical protein
MTQEEIFRMYLEDPILYEKKYLTKEKALALKFGEPSGIKLLEAIKMAIDGNIKGESENITSRKINQFLNK